MKMLLVAATRGEIEPLLKSLPTEGPSRLLIGPFDIRILITGVGMTATAFAMGRCLQQHRFDLAINAGIAGCFDPAVSAGEVFLVTEDTFSELGAENGDDFIDLSDLGFGQSTFYASGSEKITLLNELPIATSITVNTVHGNDASIGQVRKRFNPFLESMEGAAFFYACEQSGIPSVQIRAVSNLVEKRNRENWDIPKAITRLNETLIKILTS